MKTCKVRRTDRKTRTGVGRDIYDFRSLFGFFLRVKLFVRIIWFPVDPLTEDFQSFSSRIGIINQQGIYFVGSEKNLNIKDV